MAFMTIVEPSLMVRTNIRETKPKDQAKDSWEVAMKTHPAALAEPQNHLNTRKPRVLEAV